MKNPRMKPEERPMPIPAPKIFKDKKKEKRRKGCRGKIKDLERYS